MLTLIANYVVFAVVLIVYGAQVFRVDGTYEEAFELSQKAVEEFGWYNRNCAVNPYLVEGKKTGGLEIAEQLRDDPPDVVMVPVGDGCIVSGIGKGLREMHQLGVIDRLPRIIGVQAENAAPIAKAFDAGVEELTPVEATTLADSINVGTPRNWLKGLRSVRSTNLAARLALADVDDDGADEVVLGDRSDGNGAGALFVFKPGP